MGQVVLIVWTQATRRQKISLRRDPGAPARSGAGPVMSGGAVRQRGAASATDSAGGVDSVEEGWEAAGDDEAIRIRHRGNGHIAC
jgi:hypothetical protein